MSKNRGPFVRKPPGGWPRRYDEWAVKAGYESWQAWAESLCASSGRSAICGEQSHKAGSPCGNKPKRGSGRCRRHGGETTDVEKRGRGVPVGRAGKWLPSNLVNDFNATYQAPDYLTLRNQIAVNEVREAQLLRRTGSAEARLPDFERLERVTSRLSTAVVNGNGEKILKLSAELSAGIAAGATHERLWRELRTCQDHGRKLKLAEAKIMKDRDMVLDKDRALSLMMWLVGILREQIDDQRVLRNVASAIRSHVIYDADTVEHRPMDNGQPPAIAGGERQQRMS